MEYKFYVQMDGNTFGPYTAKEILGLDLLDDVLVTEESMNGTWLPARRFDFNDMYLKESGTYINDDGSISRPRTPIQAETQSQISASEFSAYIPNQEDLSKWNWGAFWFGWLWCVCNGVYWPLFTILLGAIPVIGPFIGLGVQLYLGYAGTQLAWDAKKWRSWESFRKTQRNWAKAILWYIVILLIMTVIAVITN